MEFAPNKAQELYLNWRRFKRIKTALQLRKTRARAKHLRVTWLYWQEIRH
jgi:hypothetical protein